MGLTEADLRLGRRLGKGAAAEILEVLSIEGDEYPYPVVFKRYFSPNEVSAAGLDSLHQFRERLAPSTQQLLDTRTSWPLRTVATSGGALVGYLMPRLPDDAFVTVHTATGDDLLPCEIQFLFNDERTIAQLLHASVPTGYRLAIALDLARTYALLDKYGLVFGDLSWKNLIWTPFSASPHVVLVDCDAIRMRGTSSAAPQVHSPGWIPPEGTAGAHPQTVETDRYKLGLALLRILTPGLHSQVRRADRSRDEPNLGPAGAALLERALSTTPSERPTAKEWVDVLTILAIRRPFRLMTAVEPPAARAMPPKRRVKVVRPPNGPQRRTQQGAPRSRPMPSHSRALAGVPTGQQWSPLSPSVPQAPPRRTYPRPVSSWQRTGFPPVGRGLQLVLALCFAWMLGAFLVQFVDGLSARSQPDTTTIDSTDFSDSTEASTSPPVPEPASTELTAGQTILPGGAIRTRAGSGLYMQRDGNLVLRDDDGTVTWSSGTAGTGPAFATMQADGNLVVRPASGGAAVWSTKTAGHPSAAVRLQAGTLVVVTPDGQVVWDARTAPP